MKVINSIDDIRAAQTINFPSSDDVRLANPGKVKGWSTAMFDRETGKWAYAYMQTKEEAVSFFENIKALCKRFPDTLGNWLCKSEMYIYSSYGFSKPDWTLWGCIVDDE